MEPHASLVTSTACATTTVASGVDVSPTWSIRKAREEDGEHQQPKPKIRTTMVGISTLMAAAISVGLLVVGTIQMVMLSSSEIESPVEAVVTAQEEQHNLKVEHLLHRMLNAGIDDSDDDKDHRADDQYERAYIRRLVEVGTKTIDSSITGEDEHEQDEIDFLNEYDAAKIKHSHLTLLHHLKGTHDLLQQWDQPLHLQDAGLFHSIYGTDKFRKHTVPTSERPSVEDVIGNDAETIAWAFCAMDRKSFDEQVSRMIDDDEAKVYTVECGNFQQQGDDDESSTGCRPLQLTSNQMKELAVLHVANTMEQAPRFVKSQPKPNSKWMKRIHSHLEIYGGILPPAAIESIQEFNRNHQPLGDGDTGKRHHSHFLDDDDGKLRKKN